MGSNHKFRFLIITILCVLVFSSCPIQSVDQIEGTSTTVAQQEADISNTDSVISFSFEEKPKNLFGDHKTSQTVPNEVIYITNIASNSTIMRAPINNGINSIVLPKNSTSVVGFVYNPSLSISKDLNAKGIAGGIQSMGNLNIVKANLDSIPLSSNAANDIDLGVLSVSSASIDSSISSEDTLKAIGYAELDSYSMFDSSLLKFLNPDIDQDGKYDSEQNMKWAISGLTLHDFYPDEFDTSGPILPISTFLKGDFSIVFWLNNTFKHPDYKSVFLRLPPDNVYIDRDGKQVDGVYASWHGLNAGPEGDYNQYYFNYFKSMLTSPKAPYNGDYELVLADTTYYFANLSFPKPTETGYDGFLFPQVDLDFNAEGYLQKARYKWWIIKNSRYEPPSEQDVRLIASQLIIAGKQPEDFDKAYYQNNELDFSKYNIHKRDIIGTVSGPGTYRCDYWDWAGNSYNFSYFMEGTRPE